MASLMQALRAAADRLDEANLIGSPEDKAKANQDYDNAIRDFKMYFNHF
jgi:hypothetical protein